jgi:Ni/Fe-hydrogenase subunit HybB-like protein
VLLGFVTNRLNVSVTGMEAVSGVRYVPKWTEYGITAAMVAAGFAIFAIASKYLPIFEDEHHAAPVAAEPKAMAARAAVADGVGD